MQVNNKKNKKILVIDDDPVMHNTLKKQLKDETFDVECIANPVKALKMINQQEFDLVICDVKMEPIDGLKLLKQIKQNRPQMEVIMMTGYGDQDIKTQAKRLGTNNFLEKPIPKSALINAINYVPKIF
ncbi:MAG: response regulator [Spirochaetes bacterium]|nr:response regulator [Spirochaetota bacterium]